MNDASFVCAHWLKRKRRCPFDERDWQRDLPSPVARPRESRESHARHKRVAHLPVKTSSKNLIDQMLQVLRAIRRSAPATTPRRRPSISNTSPAMPCLTATRSCRPVIIEDVLEKLCCLLRNLCHRIDPSLTGRRCVNFFFPSRWTLGRWRRRHFLVV